MKILVNKKIKSLFYKISIAISVFTMVSILLIGFKAENAAVLVLAGALGMALAIIILCCRYFEEQNKIIEDAAARIREYISGNQDVRIPCNEEGELYRLFHEINSLAAVLNAHAENEWKAKEFLKGTISDISHQLKTPLAALNIYNGILQGEAELSPTISEFTKLSEQELDRIESLVQNLLKITKLDAGALTIEKKRENLSEMLESIRKQFAFRAKQEKKELSLTGDETITLLCDRSWLTEAVGNIIKNALDHTRSGDFVHVEWKRFASVVQITVKDNGSGIHPEDMHYIFKRFYRSRFSKDTQGIGLGLPLAKAVIEAHNGTVEVDSELGAGSTFVINLIQEQP